MSDVFVIRQMCQCPHCHRKYEVALSDSGPIRQIAMRDQRIAELEKIVKTILQGDLELNAAMNQGWVLTQIGKEIAIKWRNFAEGKDTSK
jgi:hypothetical protein